MTQNGTLPPEWGGTLPPKWGNTLPPNGTFPPTPTPQTLSPTDPEFAPNTEDMVYAQIAFGFFEEGTEGTEVAEPSEDDITDLMCITMEFFRDVIRNATNDTSVQTQAMYVDWTYTEEDTESIQVSFATNATYFGTTDSVPPQTVFQALQLTEEEIVFYLENYVVGRLGTNANSSNVFADVLNSNWTTFVNKQVPVGQIEMVDCGDTKAPTAVPTVSAAPSDSSAPSMMPSVSSAPSTSSAPSLAPSVSPAPTTWAENPNYVSLVPTTWADNPNNPANGGTGTRPPTEDTGPEEPVQRPVQRLPIQVAFTVSNLNNIIEADQVNNSGLTESWPIFVEETVELISAQGNRRLLRAGHRRLSVALEPGSPRIQSIERVPCPADTHPDLTCHDTLGVYTLQLVNETNSTAVEELYGRQTANYVRSDYNDTLHREFPDTALYIGTLPPLPAGDDDDGFPIWAIILIILLVILCCLCCLLALFFLYLKDRNEEKELEPYDEEGFAYDFLIPKNEKPQTEVDDDAATKDVDEEFFEDEEAESKGIDDDNVVTVMPEDVEDHFEDEPLAEIQEGAFESDKSGEEWQDGDDEPQEEVMALEAPREATAEELESVSEEGEESTKEVSETGEELTPVSNELEESWKDEHSEKESEAEAEPDPADEETTQGGETETDAEETAEQWKDEADDESKAEDEQEASEKEASETAEEEGAEEVAEEWDVDKASEEEAFEEGDKEENEADDDWDEDSDDKEEDSDEEGWDDESK